MKIAALVRSLNEQDFIGRCCQNHQWCDAILVADGGSTDETVKIAERFNNAIVRTFDERVDLPDGSFMNPEPAHLNFLLDWADDINADWLVIVDCDTWPNVLLQKYGRRFFEQAALSNRDGILVQQIYLWGTDEYFPKIGDGVGQWARRADLGLRYDESGTSFFESVAPGVNPDHCMKMQQPYVLLHYISDKKRELEKMKRYEAWGYPKTHLLESIYAPPEPLPDWVREYQI